MMGHGYRGSLRNVTLLETRMVKRDQCKREPGEHLCYRGAARAHSQQGL